MPPLTVRLALPEDAAAIAGIHVRSWRAAYRGLVDQDFLDALSIDDRTQTWREILRDRDPDAASPGTLVAVDDDDILGWCTVGASRDPGASAEPDPDGEVYGIYADPSAWSTGVGSALLTAGERRLLKAGHRYAHLWVLDGNERADAFYGRHGWMLDGATKVEERPGLLLAEHRRTKALTS